MLDGAGIPAAKRRAFAETAVRRWSPFADPDFHVEWSGDRAMVWAWSRSRIVDDDVVATAPAPRRLLPEPLFRGRLLDEGTVLVPMAHGVEGRVWRQRLLAASEWWPDTPGIAEWNRFLRGAGQVPATALPELSPAAMATSPWSAAASTGLGEVAARHRTLLAAAAIAVVLAVMTSLVVSSLALLVSVRLVEQEIAAQDEGLQKILATREQAARDNDEIESLLALRPPAGQIELFATLASLLPAGGSQLLEWRMPDPSHVEASLHMARPDPSALVQAWESSERFQDVTVELGRTPDEISIKATVERALPAPVDGGAPATAAAAPTEPTG